eukprot:COSAG01_NODE_1248_length_11071_cov_30.622676_6_plen_215_part_00
MAAAVGALGGPAAGARASGCAHSRLPPHAALPFVGSFLRRCARPVCLRATAGAAAGLGQLTRACVGGKLLSTWLGTPGWKTRLLKSTPEVECDGWSGGAKKRRWRRWWGRSGGGRCKPRQSGPTWCQERLLGSTGEGNPEGPRYERLHPPMRHCCCLPCSSSSSSSRGDDDAHNDDETATAVGRSENPIQIDHTIDQPARSAMQSNSQPDQAMQ